MNTHYDNLKVARDAPSEAIRAAYKAYTQEYNIDTNPNADASRLMKTINHSFAVLSNPVQRAEYDRWLLAQESTTSSKEITDPSEKENPTKRWLAFLLLGLIVLITFAWLALSNRGIESKGEPSAQDGGAAVQQSLASQAKVTQVTQTTQGLENSQNTPMVVADRIPDHDQVSIAEFVGLWKGSNGGSAGQQTLDISLKSDHSIVFNLDAKAGQSIGGVYGIAEYANSYANFFNQEYNCSILFTIKSGVLHLNTDNCRAYHESGITFDGEYMKPTSAKDNLKPNPVKTNVVTKNTSTKSNQAPPAEISPATPVNAPKLLKFVATVKDVDGNVSKIELIAKDKDAARVIIRDFRGNPKVVKIKEARK